ncbi:MAG: ABC transporter permease [Ketobacter sp.]|nr:MAG: ABC transporter permease [Ketobacter sp.]
MIVIRRWTLRIWFLFWFLLGHLGAFFFRRAQYGAEVLGLLSLSIRETANLMVRSRRQVFWILFKRQLYNSGYKAAYVNCVIAALLGLALANQFTLYLQKAESFADVFVVVVLRELAPLISGIILIARSSTAIVSEIGHLKLNREFEVLHSQGINAIFLFILPALFAFPLSLLLMLVYFNSVTLLSAWLYMSWYADSDISFSSLMFTLPDRISLVELIVISSKAVFGGIIIALLSVYAGYRVGERFTDISRAISNNTTALLLLFFCLNIMLSILAY